MGKKIEKLTLSEILDLEKIKVVNNPIEKAHGLPNECYTSPEYLRFERDKIFSDNTDAFLCNFFTRDYLTKGTKKEELIV